MYIDITYIRTRYYRRRSVYYFVNKLKSRSYHIIRIYGIVDTYIFNIIQRLLWSIKENETILPRSDNV